MSWLANFVLLSHGWQRLAVLCAAGAVAGLAVPPLFFLPALFVALPIWIWALDGAERRPGLRRLFGPAFAIGVAFGVGYFTVALHWLGAAFLQQGGLFIALMPFAIVALATLLALFWGLGSALAHLFWSHGAWRLASFAGWVALAEWARGTLFSGFPFDLLGYALTANDEMIQLASVTGVYGLTVLVLVLATTPALLWPADERPLLTRLLPFFVAIGVVAAQFGYGLYRLDANPALPRDDMRARLVQPMILAHADWDVLPPEQVLDRLVSLSETRLTPDDPGLAGISLLIWPESVFPFFLSDYPDALARIARMLPDETLLLTGAPREPIGDDGLPIPDNPGYNSILALDARGELVASYDKSHLVPFGEYLPFAEFWRLFGITQFVPGTNGWAPGDGRRLMTPAGAPPFLALVCYEVVFPGDIGDPEGAEFIVNVTNDAWFDGSIGPAQHAHHARLRAVEAGLPLLRVANSGITFATDPLGRITGQLAPEQMAVLDVVPAQKLAEGTLFNRFGLLWFFGPVLLLVLAGFIASRRPARPA